MGKLPFGRQCAAGDCDQCDSLDCMCDCHFQDDERMAWLLEDGDA